MEAIHVHLMPHVQMRWAITHVIVKMAFMAMVQFVMVGNRVH